MKIRITYMHYQSIDMPSINTVTFDSVESITLVRCGCSESGACHAIKCFGNEPVTWHYVNRIEILSVD